MDEDCSISWGEQVQNVLSPLHQEQEYVRHYDRKDIRRFLWIFFAALRMWTRENPFPSEYDVDAASEYMSAFNDRIEQMKK